MFFGAGSPWAISNIKDAAFPLDEAETSLTPRRDCHPHPAVGGVPAAVTTSTINVDASVLSLAAAGASRPARQITAPKAIRDALGVAERDEIVFRVQGNHALVARAPDFLGLTARD
jgi:hypothetical protein